jgi:hypothetical protein
VPLPQRVDRHPDFSTSDEDDDEMGSAVFVNILVFALIITVTSNLNYLKCLMQIQNNTMHSVEF